MSRLVGVAFALALVASSCSDDPAASSSTSSEPVAIATTDPPDTSSSAPSTTLEDITTTTTRPQGPASTLDGPVVTADPIGGEGDMAAAGGVLELVGECLFLPEGDESVALVWPSGTSWETETQSVVLADGTQVAVGEEIEVGGGYRPGGGLIREVSSLDGRKLAEECARRSTTRSVFVMNSVSLVAAAP